MMMVEHSLRRMMMTMMTTMTGKGHDGSDGDAFRGGGESIEENTVPKDIKISSSLYYGRIHKPENHVIVFFHNTRKTTF
jgi:hypothetical protein